MQSFNIKKTCISRLISLIAVQKVKDFFEERSTTFFSFFLPPPQNRNGFFFPLLLSFYFYTRQHLWTLHGQPSQTKHMQTSFKQSFHCSTFPCAPHTTTPTTAECSLLPPPSRRFIFLRSTTATWSFTIATWIIHDRHLDHHVSASSSGIRFVDATRTTQYHQQDEKDDPRMTPAMICGRVWTFVNRTRA